MSKDFNSSNTVSVEVEVEVGDLVAWDWIVIPNGKNYALGHVGIVLNFWETKYTFAVEVAWAGSEKITIFDNAELLVVSKYRDVGARVTADVVFVRDRWPDEDI